MFVRGRVAARVDGDARAQAVDAEQQPRRALGALDPYLCAERAGSGDAPRAEDDARPPNETENEAAALIAKEQANARARMPVGLGGSPPALSLDERTFLDAAPHVVFEFDFEAHVPVIMRLLELDPNLAKMHSRLAAQGLSVSRLPQLPSKLMLPTEDAAEARRAAGDVGDGANRHRGHRADRLRARLRERSEAAARAAPAVRRGGVRDASAP